MFLMLERFMLMCPYVKKALIDEKKEDLIVGLDLSYLNDVIDALRPLKIVSRKICQRDANAIFSIVLNKLKQLNTSISNQLYDNDDATSVEIFVENQQDNIIMYKPNNFPMLDVYPEFDQKDFVIAFMMLFQVEQLDQLSNEFSVICIDATHGVGNGYKMITVLTTDEFYQGMPLAFCISKSEKKKF